MIYDSVLAGVGEVWLKGANRSFFLKKLREHLELVLRDSLGSDFKIKFDGPKIYLDSKNGFDLNSISRIQKVPGLRLLELGEKLDHNYESLKKKVLEVFPSPRPKDFKIDVQRSYKNFPKTSMELAKELGSEVILNGICRKVNLTDPEFEVRLRVLRDHIFLCRKTVSGMGGLPLGTSAKLVTMISGGFDSPVASYLMSKRGCEQVFAFFHSYPYVGDEVVEKIRKIVDVLSLYQKKEVFYVVPFGTIQSEIAKNCDPSYRTLFFRMLMVICSNWIAKKEKAKGIVTGDAIGQVSSQTVENINMADKVSEVPILRPLLGYDKEEIINLSKIVGTHDLSIIPHDDACSMFAPKHPVIKGQEKYWEDLQDSFNIDAVVEDCLSQSQILR